MPAKPQSNATRHMTRQRALVEFTDAQAAAVMAALDSYLLSGTADECNNVFGSGSGTNAAQRAHRKLRKAFYR